MSTQGQPRELATQVLEHLLAWGVLTTRQLISAPVRFSTPLSKNEVVLVESPEVGCIVYKRAPPDREDDSVQVESAFYSATSTDSTLAGLRPFIPRLLHYDERLQCLVISSASPSLTAHEYLVASGSINSVALAHIGEALFALHTAVSGGDTQPIVSANFRRVQPWTLNLSTPGKGPSPRTKMAASYLYSVSESRIVRHTIHTVMLSPKRLSLVHADMRLANVVISGSERTQIQLIDWELCGLGDSLWDLGALLGSLIYTAVARHDQTPVSQLVDESVKAMVDVLEGYRFFEDSGRTLEAAAQVVRYSTLALIQYGFEHAQVGVGSKQSDEKLLSIVEWMCSQCYDLGIMLEKRGKPESGAVFNIRDQNRP